MILVTAASGQLGKLVSGFLEKKLGPKEFMVMVRDTAKAEDLSSMKIEILKGDYYDYNSLVKNFKNIDKLLFISSGDINNRIKQHKNVIDAAKESGVKHIFYTSFVNAKNDPYFLLTLDHFETENMLKSSGLNYTILRNAFYMDGLLGIIGDAIDAGQVFYSAGNGKITPAIRSDLAEATANIITSNGHEKKIYELGSPRSYSMFDIVEDLSKVTGKKIEYVDIPLEKMQEALRNNNTPQFAIDIISQIAQAFRFDEMNVPDPTLENFLRRKPTSVEEFLRNTFSR